MAMTKTAKLNDLADAFGHDDVLSLLEEYAGDSVCPAICTNPDCDYTTEYEPDQDRGWCENCDSNTVVSAMVLMGVI